MSVQMEKKRDTLGAAAGGAGHGRNNSVHLDIDGVANASVPQSVGQTHLGDPTPRLSLDVSGCCRATAGDLLRAWS